MKEYIEERAIQIANYIIDENATVRQTAKRFGISKSTVQAVETEKVAETTENEAEQQSYPLQMTVYDSAGTAYEQTFEQEPERVVTTTTSAAELMIALGLEDKIVGIITPDNQVPEEIQPIFDGFVNLGDKKTLSKEVIVAAEPDLVIGRVANFTEETSIDSYADLEFSPTHSWQAILQ